MERWPPLPSKTDRPNGGLWFDDDPEEIKGMGKQTLFIGTPPKIDYGYKTNDTWTKIA